MLQGTAMELYRKIINKFPKINLIASGGISSVSELDELNILGIHSVVIGKAFYEGIIHPSELQKFV
jgi:phosphoribosylformimino-5-aminoimidazole carboxamide ribotide isomerase